MTKVALRIVTRVSEARLPAACCAPVSVSGISGLKSSGCFKPTLDVTQACLRVIKHWKIRSVQSWGMLLTVIACL